MWYKDYKNVRFVRLLMGHAIVIRLSHIGKTLINATNRCVHVYDCHVNASNVMKPLQYHH